MNTIVFALLILGGVPRPAWTNEQVFARREGTSIAMYGVGSMSMGAYCSAVELELSVARGRALAAMSAFVDAEIDRQTRRRVTEKGITTQHTTYVRSSASFRFAQSVSAWVDEMTNTIFVLVRAQAPEELTAAFGGDIDVRAGQQVGAAIVAAKANCLSNPRPRTISPDTFIAAPDEPLEAPFIAAWTSKVVSVGEPVHGIGGLDERTVWAAGDHGAIYERTRNAWVKVAAPKLLGALRAVWAASRDEGWAVGDQGAIVHRVHGRWRWEPSPTSSTLRAVVGRSRTDVYAVGDRGTIIHFNGKEWKEEEPLVATHLNALALDADGSVWAAGGGGELLEHDHFDWSRFLAASFDGPYVDVVAPAADRLVVIASTFDSRALRPTSQVLIGGGIHQVSSAVVVPERIAACALLPKRDELLLAGVDGDLYAARVSELRSVRQVAKTGAPFEDLIAFDRVAFAAAGPAIVELTRIK